MTYDGGGYSDDQPHGNFPPELFLKSRTWDPSIQGYFCQVSQPCTRFPGKGLSSENADIFSENFRSATFNKTNLFKHVADLVLGAAVTQIPSYMPVLYSYSAQWHSVAAFPVLIRKSLKTFSAAADVISIWALDGRIS